MLGQVTEAARLIKAFDVLVLSSRTEGTPMVLFEAMAARVPVVATAVGGVPDVVSQNEALLVPPDRPDELASAIAAVRNDPAAARTRADAAAKRLATEYAVGPWVERYAAVYRGIR
jgi:glycosyltransferase involved in cell wall biosynthesis